MNVSLAVGRILTKEKVDSVTVLYAPVGGGQNSDM
jgi:hypothetical protein